MSGVSRLRASRKNHSLHVMTTGGPRTGSAGKPSVNVDVGSDLAPKRNAKNVWQASDLDIPTKPPLSNEEPVRGEGPPATHKRGRKGSS